MNKQLETNSKPFRIGDWLILPELNRMVHPDGKHNIGSRTMQVLVNLAHSQGNVVTKETLMDTVWKDVVVTEDSLMKSISVLRKIFEGKGEDKPKIDTIRSVGYVLLSPVEYAETPRLVEEFKKRRPKLANYALITIAVLLIPLGLFWSKVLRTPDSKGVVHVTNDRGQERVPRISPDGNKVLFAGATGGNNNLDIYIKDLKTSQLDQIENPHNIETDPVWSPSGEEIAYFRNDGKDVWIIVKNILNQKEEKIITIKAIVNLSAMIWTPDAKSIIYSDQLPDQRAFALHRVDLDTREITQLTSPHPRIIGDSSPRICPDGKKLLFIRSNRYHVLYYHLIPGYGHLMIMDLDSLEVSEVTEHPVQLTGASWINNEQIVYSAVYKNYLFRINGVNLKNNTHTTLHETSEIIRNLDYHQSSKQLVFETWDESYNLWKFSDLPQKTNFSSKYFKSVNTSWNPAYHEGSNQLAYVSRQSGFAEIWVQHLDDGSNDQMTSFEGPIIRYPQWSPDGKKIAFDIKRNRNNDVLILDLATGESTTIVEDMADEMFPYWAADGQSIYYGSNQSGTFQIRQFNLSDSTDIQITTNGGIRAIPFGDVIYYCFPFSRGLWKIEDGQEKMIVENFIPNDIANWQIVNDKLFYISRSRYAKPELYFLDLITGEQNHYQSFSYPVSYTFSGFTYDTQSSSWLITLQDKVRSDIKMIRVPQQSTARTKSTPSGIAFSKLLRICCVF